MSPARPIASHLPGPRVWPRVLASPGSPGRMMLVWDVRLESTSLYLALNPALCAQKVMLALVTLISPRIGFRYPWLAFNVRLILTRPPSPTASRVLPTLSPQQEATSSMIASAPRDLQVLTGDFVSLVLPVLIKSPRDLLCVQHAQPTHTNL